MIESVYKTKSHKTIQVKGNYEHKNKLKRENSSTTMFKAFSRRNIVFYVEPSKI